MYIPHLDAACKYQYLGEMAFVWKTPKDIEEDTVFRLKLTTDIPPTTHISGRIRQSHADDSSSTSMQMENLGIAGLPVVNVACVALAVTFTLILACWVTVRLRRRRSQRVVLT